jgi:hypothetical protein
MDVTKIQKGNTTYNISVQGVAIQVERAEAAANQATVAAVAAQQAVTSTHELVGGEYVPSFDATVTYHVGNLVFHRNNDDGHVFRCIAERAPGPWVGSTDASFVQTSCYGEIMDMRGHDINLESVTVKLKPDMVKESLGGVPALSGITVFLKTGLGDEGSTYSGVTDENAEYTFSNIPWGTQYTIFTETEAVSGYADPRPKSVQSANMYHRNVTLFYRLQMTGWYVITKSSVEHIDIADWDTSNNDQAELLGYQNSQFRFAIKIKGRATQKSAWSNPGNVAINIPSLYYASTYSGTFMTDAYLADVEYPAGGEVYSRLTFNTKAILDNKGTQGVQAATFCHNATVEIGGETYHGCLPLLAMLNLFTNGSAERTEFYNTMNEYLTWLGGTPLLLRSGSWWSSEQYTNERAWRILNGNLDDNSFKTYTDLVAVPFYDL